MNSWEKLDIYNTFGSRGNKKVSKGNKKYRQVTKTKTAETLGMTGFVALWYQK